MGDKTVQLTMESLRNYANTLHQGFGKSIDVDINSQGYETKLVEKMIDGEEELLQLKIEGERLYEVDIFTDLKDELSQSCPDFLSDSVAEDSALWFALTVSADSFCDFRKLNQSITNLRERAKIIIGDNKPKTFKSEFLEISIDGQSFEGLSPHSKSVCRNLITYYQNKLSTGEERKIPGELFGFWGDLLQFATQFMTDTSSKLTLLRRNNVQITVEDFNRNNHSLSNEQLAALMGFLNSVIKESKSLKLAASLSAKNPSSLVTSSSATSAADILLLANEKDKDKRNDHIQKALDTKLFFEVSCRPQQLQDDDDVVEVQIEDDHSVVSTPVVKAKESRSVSVRIISLRKIHSNCQIRLEMFRYEVAMIRGFLQLSDKILTAYQEKGRIVVIPAKDISTSSSNNNNNNGHHAHNNRSSSATVALAEALSPANSSPVPAVTTTTSATSVNPYDSSIIGKRRFEKTTGRTEPIPSSTGTTAVTSLVSSPEQPPKRHHASPVVEPVAPSGQTNGSKSPASNRQYFSLEEELIRRAVEDDLLNIENNLQLANFLVSKSSWERILTAKGEHIYCRLDQKDAVLEYISHHRDSHGNGVKPLHFIGDESFAEYVRNILRRDFGWLESDGDGDGDVEAVL